MGRERGREEVESRMGKPESFKFPNSQKLIVNHGLKSFALEYWEHMLISQQNAEYESWVVNTNIKKKHNDDVYVHGGRISEMFKTSCH